MPLNGYWCVAGLTFRSGPVPAAASLIYHQAIESHIIPTQSDQFADAQTRVHRDVNHRGVGFRYQLCKLVELFRSDVWLTDSPANSAGRKVNTLHRILDQELETH